MEVQSMEKGVEEPLHFNKSERQMRKIASANPGGYVEDFIFDDHTGKMTVIGMQDTTGIQRHCAELRKHAPDFKVNRNKTPGKWLHTADIPAVELDAMYGRQWRMADQVTLTKMIQRFMAVHPEYTTQRKGTLGLL